MFCSPHLFTYEDLLEGDQPSTIEHAFRVAHEELGIERLLDVEGRQDLRAQHGLEYLDQNAIIPGES